MSTYFFPEADGTPCRHLQLLYNSPLAGDPAAHDGEEVLRDGGVEVEAALQHVRVQQPRVRARLRLGQLL